MNLATDGDRPSVPGFESVPKRSGFSMDSRLSRRGYTLAFFGRYCCMVPVSRAASRSALRRDVAGSSRFFHNGRPGMAGPSAAVIRIIIRPCGHRLCRCMSRCYFDEACFATPGKRTVNRSGEDAFARAPSRRTIASTARRWCCRPVADPFRERPYSSGRFPGRDGVTLGRLFQRLSGFGCCRRGR